MARKDKRFEKAKEGGAVVNRGAYFFFRGENIGNTGDAATFVDENWSDVQEEIERVQAAENDSDGDQAGADASTTETDDAPGKGGADAVQTLADGTVVTGASSEPPADVVASGPEEEAEAEEGDRYEVRIVGTFLGPAFAYTHDGLVQLVKAKGPTILDEDALRSLTEAAIAEYGEDGTKEMFEVRELKK